ncbi:hypothetical protein H5410_032346 [Solanum commersonii]|uniref:Uncharacterized protein n=1 Tax=Solanum commersonii TaxID=4109 RepID=A0A9J5YMP4_SOLCO|nr:hypothetical protein H5410_032346 [Solanum commersonii]
MEYEKPESLSVGRTKKVGKEILINHIKGSENSTEYVFTRSLSECSPTYNISLTGITVGSKTTDFDLTAIFDSSTSFTNLNDPVYKIITENAFDSEAKRPRINLMAKFLLSTAMTAMGSRKKKRLTE